MSNRRKIRETVLQALYSAIIGDHTPEHVLQTVVKPELNDDTQGLAFAEKLFLRSLDSHDEIENIIKNHISNWEIDRLAVVDRIILHMAITEILAFDDIPAKVTINEAIDIAKKFSTEKSGHFVNGILDAVVLTLKQENRLDKRGRGLVDQPARKQKKSGYTSPDYMDTATQKNLQAGENKTKDHDEDRTYLTPKDKPADSTDDSEDSRQINGTESDKPREKKKRIKRPKRSPRT